MVTKAKTTKKSEQDGTNDADLSVDLNNLHFESEDEYRKLFEQYNAAFIQKTQVINSLDEERKKIIEILKVLYENHRMKYGSPDDDFNDSDIMDSAEFENQQEVDVDDVDNDDDEPVSSPASAPKNSKKSKPSDVPKKKSKDDEPVEQTDEPSNPPKKSTKKATTTTTTTTEPEKKATTSKKKTEPTNETKTPTAEADESKSAPKKSVPKKKAATAKPEQPSNSDDDELVEETKESKTPAKKSAPKRKTGGKK
jgi:hypothetical protein